MYPYKVAAVQLAWFSVFVGVFLALLVPFLLWGFTWRQDGPHRRGMRAGQVGVTAYLGDAVLPASVIVGATFCILYAIINPLVVKNVFNLCVPQLFDFLKADYGRHTVGLRILSVWLGFHALNTTFQFILVEGGFRPWTWGRPFNWVCKKPRSEDADGELAREELTTSEYALDITDLAQFGIYLVAVNTWWWLVIRPEPIPDVIVPFVGLRINLGFLIPVLSWVLLAVFDDYLLISQYAHRNAAPSRWQKVRLAITNAFLLIAVPSTIIRPLHWPGITLNIVMVVLFTGWRYTNQWKTTRIIMTILNTSAVLLALLFIVDSLVVNFLPRF